MADRYITERPSLAGNAQAIAMQFMNPENVKIPIRYAASGTNLEGSMVAQSKLLIKWQWNQSTQDAGHRLTSPNDNVAFLYWDAIRNICRKQVGPSAAGSVTCWYAYSGVFQNDARSVSFVNPAFQYDFFESEGMLKPTFFQTNSAATLALAIPGAVNPSLTNGQQNWTPHGGNHYLGFNPSKTKYGFWLDADNQTQPGPNNVNQYGIQITYSPEVKALASGFLEFNIYRWDGKDFRLYDTVTNINNFSTGYTTYQVADTGYYAVGVKYCVAPGASPASGTLLGFGLNFYSTMSESLAHSPVEGFDPAWALGALLGGTRVLGTSMWMQNVASDFNKQGTLVACQSTPGEDMQFNYLYATTQNAASGSSNLYQTVSGKMGVESFPNATGYFGWKKITDLKSLEWRESVSQGRQNSTASGGMPLVADISYPLKDPDGFLVLVPTTTAPLGGDAQLIVATNYEYQSQKTQLIKEPATTTNGDWAAALNGIAFLPQHFPNALHKKSIWSGIASLVGKGLRSVGGLGEVLPGPWGMGAGLARGLGNLIGEFDDSPESQAVQAMEEENADIATNVALARAQGAVAKATALNPIGIKREVLAAVGRSQAKRRRFKKNAM